MVLPPPTGVQLRGPFFVIEVDREDFREFLYPKWPDSDNEALQKATSESPIRLLDLSEHALVRLIQRFRKFLQGTTDTWRKTVTQSIQLAEYPPKPV
jgi:hypothetical protein